MIVKGRGYVQPYVHARTDDGESIIVRVDDEKIAESWIEIHLTVDEIQRILLARRVSGRLTDGHITLEPEDATTTGHSSSGSGGDLPQQALPS